MAQALLSASQRQTTSFYDRAAARYADYAAQFDMEGVLGGFLSTIGPAHRVLDVGCGSGRDLTALRDIAGVAIGLDLSQGLLEEARRGSEAPVLRADAARLPVADTSIDRVLAVASLHHLPPKAQVKALKEIRRVLRLDGQALVTVKLGRGKLRDRDRATGEERVFHLASRRRFVRRARRSGLQVMTATESTVIRHGREQLWLAGRLSGGVKSSDEQPIQRVLSALLRRSSGPDPSNRRRVRATT